MLDIMRRQPYLIYPIFGGIIFIFALSWGPGSASCERQQDLTWAATVDGEVIRQHDFARLYSQQVDYVRRLSERSGQPFTPELADRLGLPKQAIESLVETRLLARQAAELGLQVSDAALRDELRQRFGFDRFSFSEYEDIVSQRFDTTVSQFEAERRGDVAARQLGRILSDSITLSDGELRQEFIRQHDRARLRFVRFAPQPGDVKEPPAAVLDKLIADEPAALEAQYNKDIAHYRTPAQMHLRQLHLPLPPPERKAHDDAGDAAADEAREAALEAASQTIAQAQQRLAKGEDFAEVARQLAPAGPGGEAAVGDLGWLTEDDVAPPLAEAVRQLAPGSVTPQPVRSATGLHLVQLVERRDAVIKELSEVQREVALRTYRARLAGQAAKAAASDLLRRLQAGGRWERLVVDGDTAAHQLDVGLQRGVTGAPRLTAKSKPAAHRTSWFRRVDASIPQVGQAPQLHHDLFAAPSPAPQGGLLPQVYPAGDDFLVAAVDERELPDLAGFAAERDMLFEDHVQAKRQRVLRDMLAFWRSRSKVRLNPLVFGTRSGPG